MTSPNKDKHQFDVVFESQDDGGYTAYVPDLPSCVNEGETLDEAATMIREAMALYLESRLEHGWSLVAGLCRRSSTAS
ncbi:MAG: type II toxin-antitoxin system HicB family antitoxin [Solirubrobacteraceae bacterium]